MLIPLGLGKNGAVRLVCTHSMRSPVKEGIINQGLFNFCKSRIFFKCIIKLAS